jgi:glucokinase
MDAAELFAAAASDPRARLLIDEALSGLALHLANWAILLDPARIAVGGGFMGSPELILGVLRFKLEHLVPYPPELVTARFVQDGALRGAIALAVRTLPAG